MQGKNMTKETKAFEFAEAMTIKLFEKDFGTFLQHEGYPDKKVVTMVLQTFYDSFMDIKEN